MKRYQPVRDCRSRQAIAFRSDRPVQGTPPACEPADSLLLRALRFWLLVPAVLLSWPGLVQADGRLTLEVVAATDQQPLAARVYCEDHSGRSFYFAAPGAVPYDRQNWINDRSVERHTSLLPGPASVELPPGRYVITVERGKEFLSTVRELEMTDADQTVRIELSRMVNMAERGWYSSDLHLHRSLDEVRTCVQSEDLNVSFPLTYWETRANFPPAAGNKNQPGEIPDQLIAVDATHVIWPRNTEYEIFTVGPRQHTLGALFVLNHRSVLRQSVPPWGPAIEAARQEGALFDLDKLDWPFSLTLPVLTGTSLYELSNNHLWRTEFAFRDWNSPAAPYLQPPFGNRRGNERDWLHYTLGMWYTLLNAGTNVIPVGGTASGVHPVPAGFGRVYAHVDGEFTCDRWLEALRQSRCFVTTGPLLEARIAGQMPGSRIPLDRPAPVSTAFEIWSEQPISFVEVIQNGQPVQTIFGQSQAAAVGFRFQGQVSTPLTRGGWLALRVWENRDGGRFRFAHTAPWWIDIPHDEPMLRPEERDWLVSRMDAELARSAGVLAADALQEYQLAREHWKTRPVVEQRPAQVRRPVTAAAEQAWLENMLVYHRYAPAEVAAVTGMSHAEQAAALEQHGIDPAAAARFSDARLTVLPYPGGRHPRSGFLDGAIHPQRDTKFSVFLPWERPQSDPPGSRGYVVVDLPEAIFTNLGLTYLAHSHVPTIWEQQKLSPEPLEWTVTDSGLDMQRLLPNGIRFGATVRPGKDVVEMTLWLKNGTSEPLTGMRVQNCVMLRAAPGFHDQTNANKVFRGPFVAVHDDSRTRWIITAWTPNHRSWANAPCPCLHSDPILPDCAPGETATATGRLWFYEGQEIDAYLDALATALPSAKVSSR